MKDAERVEVQLMAEANVVRPGDTLLVRIAGEFTAAQAERVSDALRDQLPGVKVCVISGVDGVNVYRPTSE